MRNPFESNELQVFGAPPKRTDPATRRTKRGPKYIDYPATQSPTSLDIAFAAGFYEGEGNYSLKFGYYPIIYVGQNDREKLDWLQVRFGGIVGGPYATAIANKTYAWRLYRERALGFMYTMLKFLSDSRKQQFLKGGTPEGKRKYQKWISDAGIDLEVVKRALTKHLKRQEKRMKGPLGIFGVKK